MQVDKKSGGPQGERGLGFLRRRSVQFSDSVVSDSLQPHGL